MITIEELFEDWLASRLDWLDTAMAINASRTFFITFTPSEFLLNTSQNMFYITDVPSLKGLVKARNAAQVFLIAREQGLEAAMLWKLMNF